MNDSVAEPRSGVVLPFTDVLVGHVTHAEAKTGCTVVLFPDGSVASAEVRGGAPATREIAMLDPTKSVARIDAVVLSGGSAFGLAACDGVMAWCEANGRGFSTAAGPVPIVVGLSLFDLMQGDATIRPTAADGRAAAETAAAGFVPTGLVGAGTGATSSKWRGKDHVRPTGIGVAVVRSGDLVVAAIIGVNPAGDIDDGVAVAALANGNFEWPDPATSFGDPASAVASTFDGDTPLMTRQNEPPGRENTTIGVVITNARLSKVGCRLLAESGHDGMARAIFPAHTRSDGDALVAVSVPTPGAGAADEVRGVEHSVGADSENALDSDLDRARILGAVAVERAVRSLA